MTDTPFASVPTLCDAVPALSSPPRGYVDETKVCVYCDATYYRFTKTPQRIWDRRTHCANRKCTSKGDKARAALRPTPQGGPKDRGREAELYRGLAYEDDPRAVLSEIRFTKLPEPQYSPHGNGTAMCASARRT